MPIHLEIQQASPPWSIILLQLIHRTWSLSRVYIYIYKTKLHRGMENEGGRSAMNNPGAVIENFKAPRIGTRSVGRRKLKLAPLISRFFVEGDVGRETMRNGIKRGTFARIFLFPMKTSSWHWSTGVPFPIGCLNLWPFRAQKHARIISIVRGSQLRSISVLVASIDRSSVLACVCVCVYVYFLDTISREEDLLPAFLLLPRFRIFVSSSRWILSFCTYIYIQRSPSSIHASMNFFTCAGYERLIFPALNFA